MVFDLDDTLCDTMGQLVMPAHAEAAAAMRRAGLARPVEEILAARLSVWRSDPRADVDAETARRLGGDEASAEAGRDAYFNRRVGRLDPLPDALAVLDELAEARLALVTRGGETTQKEKISLLGVADRFDPVIVVPTDRTKDEAFTTVVEAWGIAPRLVAAVGDRPDVDVAAARRAGLVSVRLLRGEYAALAPRGPDEAADASVATLADVPAALRSIWGLQAP